jgi:hypothetical protein
MVVLRLSAVALVACTAAGADPAPAPSALPGSPASWKALPTIAHAVASAAAADGVTVDAADAWGDPAVGCFALRLAIHGGAAATDALVDQVLAGQAGQKITFTDVVKPAAGQDVLAFGFARAPYRGRVRARLTGGKITAMACFGNQREPVACDATCTHMLQGAP